MPAKAKTEPEVGDKPAEEVVEYVPPDVTGKNLMQRLAMVKQAIGKVGKSARAPKEMGGFKYVPWEGVADRIGDLFADHGIVPWTDMPEFVVEQTADKVGEKRKTNYRTTVKLEIDLVNADDPDDHRVIHWSGVGDDTSDKGLQKAATNGVKYALMKAMMLGGMGGADDSDATKIDEDSESAPDLRYGMCPAPGCKGHVVRKTISGGRERAECSTYRYRGKDKPAEGCQWGQWAPNWEKFEHNAKIASGEIVPPSPGAVDPDPSTPEEAREGAKAPEQKAHEAKLAGVVDPRHQKALELLSSLGTKAADCARKYGWTPSDGAWSTWVPKLTGDALDALLSDEIPF